MKTLLMAIGSICLSVAAQFLLKAGVSDPSLRATLADGAMSMRALAVIASSPGIVLGFALYGLGAVVWMTVLAQWDVSKAYPLVGLGFVGTLIVGYVLGEQVSVLRALGVILICCGVVIVSRT